MQTLHVIKIGGNVINNELYLHQFLTNIPSISHHIILIHGGGKLVDELAVKLNIPQQKIDGRRITDLETLNLATMVYAGLINKNIVAVLQANHKLAIGLTGADANCIEATKRSNAKFDYGFVGDIIENGINTTFISSLLQQQIMPVFCAITQDGKGQLLNTNADTLAAEIAIAMCKTYKVQLHFCFEKKGVLSNANDENAVIESISANDYVTLKSQKVISNGMIPKLDNAFAAIKKGVEKVQIGDANNILQMIENKPHAATTLIA